MNTLEAKRALQLQAKVCQRAETQLPGWIQQRITTMMDLDSCPNLDLRELLKAPIQDFAHDMFGIAAHMDRTQYPGHLTDCFEPRYNRPPQKPS